MPNFIGCKLLVLALMTLGTSLLSGFAIAEKPTSGSKSVSVKKSPDSEKRNAEEVRVYESRYAYDRRQVYDNNLLRLAIEAYSRKHPEKLPTTVSVNPPTYRGVVHSQNRRIKMLGTKDGADVITAHWTKDRAELGHAVRFPIVGGMLGKRVCITTRSQLHKFKGIKNLAEFKKKIKIGLKYDWPDSKTMAVNGFEVVEASTYEGFFDLLTSGRVECLSRSVQEVVREVELRPEPNLVIEPQFGFSYDAEHLFFVSSIEIRDMIEEGLFIALKEGSVSTLLNKIFKVDLKQLAFASRKIFNLKSTSTLDFEMSSEVKPFSESVNQLLMVKRPRESGAQSSFSTRSLETKQGPASKPVRWLRILGAEDVNDTRHLYYRKLLNLVLDRVSLKSKTTYRVEVVSPQESGVMSQSRALESLDGEGGLDIVTSVRSAARDLKFNGLPVKLDQGLFGLRVCIVASKSRSEFPKVTNLSEFQKVLVGLGHDWPDVQKMQSAGVSVVTATRYLSLFQMLMMGRFDCFSRTVLEAVEEIDVRGGVGFQVQPGFATWYPSSLHFYLSKKDKELSKLLHTELKAMEKSGELLKLLLFQFGESFKSLNFGQRTIVPIRPLSNQGQDSFDKSFQKFKSSYEELLKALPESENPQ